MKTATEKWSADMVREAISVGLHNNRSADYNNLTVALAIRLTGDFQVEVSAHEIVVADNFKRSQ